MNVAAYYERILKQPMLSREEEFDLFMELQDLALPADVRAKIQDRIIEANLRFVFKEAKRLSKNDPNLFPELISAGNEGLLVAMEKFTPESGNRFLTYAGWWVSQRMFNSMAKQRIVALPVWRQQLSARIQKVVDANEDITFEELKKEFPDVQEKDLRELFQTKFLTFYIEDLGDDSAFEINPIEEEVEEKLDRENLHSVIAGLPELHRQVIELSFGIVDGEERKPAEIAKELSITKTQVKAIKKEALSMLKEALGDNNPFA